MTRLILVVYSVTVKEQDAVCDVLNELGAGWAHYMPTLWFIEADDAEELTATKVTNRLRKTIPHRAAIVMGVEETTEWSGYGADEMFKWLKKQKW